MENFTFCAVFLRTRLNQNLQKQKFPCKNHINFSLSLIKIRGNLENIITAWFQEITAFDKYSNCLITGLQRPSKILMQLQHLANSLCDCS